jgi:hypothetical protein
MARKVTEEERAARVKKVVAAMLAEEAAGGFGGRPGNINDIENTMVEIGDRVAREVGAQLLAACTAEAPPSPSCPKCGHAGQRRGNKTRDVITRRGNVAVTEARYYCRECRQLFSPSDRRVGT